MSMQTKTYKKALDACEAYRKDPENIKLTTEQHLVYKRLEFAHKMFKDESNVDTYMNAGAVHTLLKDLFNISRSQACLDLTFALEIFATDFTLKGIKSVAIDTLLSIIRKATRENDEKMRLKAITELRFATGFHLVDDSQPTTEQRIGAVIEIEDDVTKRLIQGLIASQKGTLDLNTLKMNDLKLTELLNIPIKELKEGEDWTQINSKKDE